VTGCAIGATTRLLAGCGRFRLGPPAPSNAVPVHRRIGPRPINLNRPRPLQATHGFPQRNGDRYGEFDDDLASTARPWQRAQQSILFRLRDSHCERRVRRRRRFPGAAAVCANSRVTRRASVTQWVFVQLVDRRGDDHGGATSSTVTYSAGAGPSLTLYAYADSQRKHSAQGACL